ncbi:MAG: YciI family protein [Flavisolibacter sp.]
MRKQFLLLLITALSSIYISAQNNKPLYDSVLAKKLGADDYGMKLYVMAFLKRGTNKNVDSASRAQLIQGHLKNIGRLAKEGKLVVAGPFLDKSDLAGVFVFNVTTIEEAKTLTASDPAVKAGLFEIELHPWYGSAALMQVIGIHSTLQKKNITD